MKNIILLLVLITFTSNKCYSQCSIPLNEILKSINYNFSEFENFALTNGFSYNSIEDKYVCDSGNKNFGNLLLMRTPTEETILITYVFINKNEYITYKSELELNGELLNTDKKNDTLTYIFKYKEKLVIMSTVTSSDFGNENIYTICTGN
jgi:hypothetical protein